MRRAFDHLRERIRHPGELERRRFLGLLGGGALAASGGRIAYEVTGYDTYHLRWLFGDSVDAYDTHHRASGIHYSA